VVAGSWYPGRKDELGKMMDGFLKNAKKENLGRIKALIAPHAGYAYSGQVAAYSYRQVMGEKYKTVYVLAPTHHVAFRGASVIDKTHYRTPLGDVPVSPVAKNIREGSKLIHPVPEADVKEHSLEIQLPFLQKTLGDFELIPITVGQLSSHEVEEIADVIIKHLDDDSLIVASTDLSHYYPYDTAVSMDAECVDAILDLDIEKASGCEMCGVYPVMITMSIAKKLGWGTKVLKYSNSGDVTGDTAGVVGYAAIAFYVKDGREKGGKEKAAPAGEFDVGQRRYLLGLARESIAKYLENGEVLEPHTDDKKLKEHRGVFVTLEKNGQLRGCIGHLEAVQPLYLDVRDNAINAAFEDPRFRPVSEDELEKIEIEISVLSKPENIKAEKPQEYLENIRPGADGIILEYKGRGATYLPQVWEQIPDKEAFLESLCNKAGLPGNAWKEKDVKLSRYRVEAFKESDYE